MNYRPVTGPCALLLSRDYTPGVHDPHGCVLAVGHAGPHEFVANNDQVWQWETDWECDCESCMNDGDFCVVYWPKETSQQPA